MHEKKKSFIWSQRVGAAFAHPRTHDGQVGSGVRDRAGAVSRATLSSSLGFPVSIQLVKSLNSLHKSQGWSLSLSLPVILLGRAVGWPLCCLGEVEESAALYHGSAEKGQCLLLVQRPPRLTTSRVHGAGTSFVAFDGDRDRIRGGCQSKAKQAGLCG